MSESITKPVTLPPVTWLSPVEWSALEKYCERTRSLYGDRIHEMILFGSRVRGEGHEESDLDVAVIITTEDSNLSRELYDIATELWLETEIKISPLVFSIKEYKLLLQMKKGIAVAIHKEGVAV